MTPFRASRKKILLIGPLPDEKAGRIGGARVSFDQLVQYLTARKRPFFLINTQPWSAGWKKYANPLSILFEFFSKVGKTDLVFVNVSRGGARYLVPLIFVFSKLFGKPIVFRPFGGSLAEEYASYASLQRWLFDRTALRVDLLLLQTGELVEYFRDKAKRIYWLPTSRMAPSRYQPRNDYRKRLVYLGHIKKSKGIDVLLEAFRQLGDDFTLDVYGPVMEDQYLKNEIFRSVYRGVIAREEIAERLSAGDLLILPTFFEGEGYPGAIIEAYSMGIPVIATRWKAIPEIVDHQRTGILIPVRSVEDLAGAIRHFTPENYPRYSGNARKKYLDQFDATRVNDQLFDRIDQL